MAKKIVALIGPLTNGGPYMNDVALAGDVRRHVLDRAAMRFAGAKRIRMRDTKLAGVTTMTMAWRGLLAAFVVVGAAVMPASPASADSGLPAITHVYWTGAPCIDVMVAARFDPTQVQGRTVCEGTWRLSESNIWPGDAFGVDPIMGAADFIECAIFRGGERVWYDSAVAGDATDVTCLRRAV